LRRPGFALVLLTLLSACRCLSPPALSLYSLRAVCVPTGPCRQGVVSRFASGRTHASNRLARASVALDTTGRGAPDVLDSLNNKLDNGLGSALLLGAAGSSMSLANWPNTASSWIGFWRKAVGPSIGGGHSLSIQGWVNEGLMSLFFFYVGLEIKKELAEGSLASPKQALLPCIAAVGGMVVPMAIYALVNRALPGGSMAGMTIPMATDIAFAMGVFGLFRRRMPPAAEPFLLTLATVDDIGAIVVIAVCFAGQLVPRYLFGAAMALGFALALGQRGIRRSSRGLAAPALALWYCLLRGGLNADMAGFLAALCVPMRSPDGSQVVRRLIRRWSPVCGLVILPLFALVNCAVPLAGSRGSMAVSAWPVAAGVGLGLLLGKPLGIWGFSRMAVLSGVSALPPGMDWRHLGVVGLLGSMGFTMCLFLIENTLTSRTAELTKAVMLLASILGAVLSAASMRAFPLRDPAVDHITVGPGDGKD